MYIKQPRVEISIVEDDRANEFNNFTVFVVLEQSVLFLPLNLSKLITERKLLILRHNDISSIDAGAFDDISLIEFLNLANNKNINFVSQQPDEIHCSSFAKEALDQFRVSHIKLKLIETIIFGLVL